MEATGHGGWLERLLAELQFELWIGNAAEIRRQQVRKQKTDRQEKICENCWELALSVVPSIAAF